MGSYIKTAETWLSNYDKQPYRAHTEPLFKQLQFLEVKDIFDIQCMKFWHKFVNNKLPNHSSNLFRYMHELNEIGPLTV